MQIRRFADGVAQSGDYAKRGQSGNEFKNKILKTILKEPSCMVNYKIFLASSEKLVVERLAFGDKIQELNQRFEKQQRKIKFSLYKWERETEIFSIGRKQSEHNENIKNSDIFVMLFSEEVGKYTEEEYDYAHNCYLEKGKPLIIVYHKKHKKESNDSSKSFQDKLLNIHGQYMARFESVTELVSHFEIELNKIFKLNLFTIGTEHTNLTNSRSYYLNKKQDLHLPVSYTSVFNTDESYKNIDDLKTAYLNFEKDVDLTIYTYVYNLIFDKGKKDIKKINDFTFEYKRERYQFFAHFNKATLVYEVFVQKEITKIVRLPLVINIDAVGKIRQLSLYLSEPINKIIYEDQLGDSIRKYLIKRYENALNNFTEKIKEFEAELSTELYEIIENAFFNHQINSSSKGKYFLGITQEYFKNNSVCIYTLNSQMISVIIDMLKKHINQSARSILEIVIDFVTISMRDQTLFKTNGYENSYHEKFEKFKEEMNEQDDNYYKILQVEDIVYAEKNKRSIYINQITKYKTFRLIVNASGALSESFDKLLKDTNFCYLLEERFCKNVDKYLKKINNSSVPILVNAFNSKIRRHV